MYTKELIEFCKVIKPIKLSVTKNPTELDFKSRLFEETSFLDVYVNVPIALRYHCVINSIYSIPKCICCDSTVNYKVANPSLGFSSYCGQSCSRSDKTVSKETLEKLSNKEWLYNERITLQKSKDLIAEELNCSVSPINKWISIHKIPEIKYNESNSEALIYLRDKKWLYNEHVIKHRSCDDIAKKLNSTKSTISVYLAKHNIPANEPNSYERKSEKVTKPTLEIKDFIRTFYSGEIKLNVRNIIGSLELDIYLPEYDFAIEFNGVYSHLYRPDEKTFSAKKDKNYHITKTKLCEEKGIQLIHIFSSSWENNKNIWKSFIKNKLKFTERKIYARECEIRNVSVYEKNDFLENNHLQGKEKSSFKYGLYYNNELVSIVTFGKSRYNKNYDWELIRFANKINTNVVGGFSKLLKYFRNIHKGSIISYADRTYSIGDLYEKNGFSLLKINPPNYYYVKKNSEILLHRSNFTKKKLLKLMNKPEWTEEQIMFELGYSKIFDCGTKTFILE